MPSRRASFGRQPSAYRRSLERSLRGTPSGFDRSQEKRPANPTTSAIRRASSAMVWSAPAPMLIRGKPGLPTAMRAEGFLRQAHEEDAGLGHVVAVQELPARAAAAPEREFRGAVQPGLVAFADQRRQHVRRGQVVVVARPVQVGRHRGKVAGAVLPVVGGAHLDAGDLRQRIGAVGGLQLAGEEVVLLDGLRACARIDAARTQEQQPLHLVAPAFVDDVGLHRQVGVDELRGIGFVGEDAADLRRREHHVVGPLRVEKFAHRKRIPQVQLGTAALQDVRMAAAFEAAHQRRPHQPAMSRHENFRVLFHAPLSGPW